MLVETAPAVRESLILESGVRRVLVTISYDGTAYVGWQRQLNGMSVQQKVEEALFKVLGAETPVTGASRTDAGVHAMGQCAHFDTRSTIPADRFPYALNTHLPPDIKVIEGREVDGLFHARFDAVGKTYTYRIHNAPHSSALHRNYMAHVPGKLDLKKMNETVKDLFGTHDFAAFQAVGGSAKTTVRTLTFVELTREEQRLTLLVQGNAFLYNMVRIIAGTLLEIGKGKLDVHCFRKAFDTGDRLCLGPTAPACGLELTQVFYQHSASSLKEKEF